MTDPIADMLTKIRNATRAEHRVVDVRPSIMAQRILEVLKQEGYISSFKVVGDTPAEKICRVYLKYKNKVSAIKGLRRVSKPGVRMYSRAARLPRVLGGMGVALITTSQGVMTDKEAFSKKIGGEILCYVW